MTGPTFTLNVGDIVEVRACRSRNYAGGRGMRWLYDHLAVHWTRAKIDFLCPGVGSRKLPGPGATRSVVRVVVTLCAVAPGVRLWLTPWARGYRGRPPDEVRPVARPLVAP